MCHHKEQNKGPTAVKPSPTMPASTSAPVQVPAAPFLTQLSAAAGKAVEDGSSACTQAAQRERTSGWKCWLARALSLSLSLYPPSLYHSFK